MNQKNELWKTCTPEFNEIESKIISVYEKIRFKVGRLEWEIEEFDVWHKDNGSYPDDTIKILERLEVEMEHLNDDVKELRVVLKEREDLKKNER